MLEDWLTDDWQNTNTVRASQIWFKAYFQSAPTGDYGVIYEYALKKWDSCLHAKQRIEDKADSLLKFSSVIAGGIMALAKTGNIPVAYTSRLPLPVTLFCLSAVFALAAMRTSNWPGPMSIKSALESVGGAEVGTQQAQLAASMHVSSEAALVLVFFRSRLLDGAYGLSIVGVLSLGWLLF